MTEGRVFPNERGRSQDLLSKDNAPVGCLFWNRSVTAIPGVWVTKPVHEPTPGRTGRVCIGRYPGSWDTRFGPFDVDERLGSAFASDDEGWLALRLGADYCDQGMQVQDPAFADDRIGCFRAAEALGLWAASKGVVQAYVNLGYIYCYDYCQGRYVGADEHGREFPYDPQAQRYEIDCDERAHHCFSIAARAGHPQAMYKLGDLAWHGRGCDPDSAAAMELWERAFHVAQEYDNPLWWGAAALRLVSANEDGEAYEQSFSRALAWYTHAENGLRTAVEAGDWFYEESLARAVSGKARCAQELA